MSTSIHTERTKILPRIIVIEGVFVGLPCFISSDSFVCGMIICNLDSNLGVSRSFVFWAYQTRIRDGHFIYCSVWHSKSDANLEYSQIFSSFPLIHAPYRRNYNPFRLSFCANETAQRKSKSQLFFKNVTKNDVGQVKLCTMRKLSANFMLTKLVVIRKKSNFRHAIKARSGS